jgi:hypothetical protein
MQCLLCIEIDGQKHMMINLCLSFGGSACPAEWCLISETITDLANRVINDDSWDQLQIQSSMMDKVPQTKL